MKIAFYGAGRAGKALYLFFKEKGLEVTGIYSRRLDQKEASLDMIEVDIPILSFESLYDMDVVILTVEDRSIKKEAKRLIDGNVKAIIGHVSGSLPSTVIGRKGRFSLHPAMSLASVEAYKNLDKAIFSIEGDEEGLKAVKSIVDRLKVRYVTIEPEKKTLYHTACVISSNYLVAIESIAKELLVDIGFPKNLAEEIVLSLGEGTLNNMKRLGIEKALTGPIARGDWDVVERHKEELAKKDELIKDIYTLLATYLAKLKEKSL